MLCVQCHEAAEYIWCGFSVCADCATVWWEVDSKLGEHADVETILRILAEIEEGEERGEDVNLCSAAAKAVARIRSANPSLALTKSGHLTTGG